MIERKHTLVRVKAGDYLLLSNDKRTLWRIAKYEEDGSACFGDSNRPITGERWGLWRYTRPITDATKVRINPDKWDDFEMDECLLRSRQEAVEDALKMEATNVP